MDGACRDFAATRLRGAAAHSHARAHVVVLHRGAPHRSVFTAAAISLQCGLISWVFRAFPPNFAGAAVGTGAHALTWMFAVIVSCLPGRELEHFLVFAAVKLTDPSVRI